MCDYSLELYKSRPAVEGEELTFHRFPSGTIGLVGNDATGKVNIEVACCVLPGTTMVLSGISEATQRSYGIGPVEEVVFHKFDVVGHAHKDAVRFANGRELILGSLNPGIRAQVTGMSPEATLPPADGQAAIETIAELIG